jgi:very-short-patch-repair endonuclease
MAAEICRKTPGRRQQPAVDTDIVDFFCAKSKRMIEVDGDPHVEQVASDAAQTQWLNEERSREALFRIK